MVEHSNGNGEVIGSTPIVSSSIRERYQKHLNIEKWPNGEGTPLLRERSDKSCYWEFESPLLCHKN